MRDFDGLRKIHSDLLSRREGFDYWYALLKLCFPIPDYALAFALGVYPSHFAQWKSGVRKPCGPAIQAIALLCFMRAGGPRSTYDLVKLNQDIATGRFEKRILSYLAHEREVEARRKARAAEKEAKSAAQSIDLRNCWAAAALGSDSQLGRASRRHSSKQTLS